MPTYQINLTFTEPLLGSAPLDKRTYETYILPKAPQLPPDEAAEELASVGNGMDSKGVTGFHRTEDGKPILYDYVLKGFAKDACGMMRRVPGSESAALKAYKSVIDGMLFPAPRQIVLDLPPGADITILSRPLRAETAQGPRVAIATSEQAPAGTTCTFTVNSLGVITEALLREWFDCGALRGLGGWRSASWGRFSFSMHREN